jgi:hypothetical protein
MTGQSFLHVYITLTIIALGLFSLRRVIPLGMMGSLWLFF